MITVIWQYSIVITVMQDFINKKSNECDFASKLFSKVHKSLPIYNISEIVHNNTQRHDCKVILNFFFFCYNPILFVNNPKGTEVPIMSTIQSPKESKALIVKQQLLMDFNKTCCFHGNEACNFQLKHVDFM